MLFEQEPLIYCDVQTFGSYRLLLSTADLWLLLSTAMCCRPLASLIYCDVLQTFGFSYLLQTFGFSYLLQTFGFSYLLQTFGFSYLLQTFGFSYLLRCATDLWFQCEFPVGVIEGEWRSLLQHFFQGGIHTQGVDMVADLTTMPGGVLIVMELSARAIG